MTESFGAVLQSLPTPRDRVLAAGRLAEAQADEGRFRPAEISSIFDAFHVPPPSNVSEYLSRLATDKLVLKRRAGGWSLTPNGQQTVASMIGALDVAIVGAEQVSGGSANFDGFEHPLIPPAMAPLRFRAAVEAVLAEAPFERNVFLMTRFPPPNDPSHPLAIAIETARHTLESHGLMLHLASDRQADDELFPNVAAHIWASKFGIALLETMDTEESVEQHLNDNMLIEVGAMLISGRRCCLLKDSQSPPPPTDFVAQIYKELEIGDPGQVAAAINGWVTNDLHL